MTRRGWRAFVPLVLLFVTVFSLSGYANAPRLLDNKRLLGYVPPFRAGWDSNLVQHLGGEYLCIARAIASGRGFSDPFGVETGPTAWMPPVYPVLLAALLKVFGEVQPVVYCVVVLQNLALVFGGWVVLRFSRRTATRPGDVMAALVLYLLALCYEFNLCFQFTHDHWIVTLVLSAMVVLADRMSLRAPGSAASIGWGVFGALSALTSPVLGFVWAILTINQFASFRKIRPFGLSVLLAVLIVAPWVARNYWMLDRFIPIKSNAFYELYQSNDMEADGLLQRKTATTHPFAGENEARKRYQEIGEVRFLDEFREKFLRSLRRDPLAYVTKVGNRLLAATVLYHPYNPNERDVSYWAGCLLHPLPFYGFLLLLLRGGFRRHSCQRISMIVYVSYMLPYVLVAYYERYQFPLLPVRVLFCYWGWQTVRAFFTEPAGTDAELSPGVETQLK